MSKNKIIKPSVVDNGDKSLLGKINLEKTDNKLDANFEYFKLSPLKINNSFSNYFKDINHFSEIASEFLGIILPKITSHTYNQICEGSQESKILHFHVIDKDHREIIFEILKKYGFNKEAIEQMMEGKDLVSFSATLGHRHAARAICHKVGNTLYFLFLDTNHHIYMNDKYLRETLFYETCPFYTEKSCSFMPDDCYAVSYLDEKKIKESFCYTYIPSHNL